MGSGTKAACATLGSFLVAAGLILGGAGGSPGPPGSPVIERGSTAPGRVAAVGGSEVDGRGPNGAHTTSAVSVDVATGPLVVLDPPSSIALARQARSDRFIGTVGGLRVVDARGSGAGWRLTMRITEVQARWTRSARDAVVRVRVRRVLAFADSTAGLDAPADAPVAPRHTVLLARAAPGHGLGAFDVTATIDARVRGVTGHGARAAIQFAVS